MDKIIKKVLKKVEKNNEVFNITADTFVISDTHFAHEMIFKKEPSRKPFAKMYGYDDFYEFLLHRWNQNVTIEDKILHLGDLYFNNGLKYVNKLNGKKMLLVGNNDIGKFEKLKDNKLKSKQWQVCNFLSLNIEGKEKILENLSIKFSKENFKDPYLNAIVCDIGDERIMFSHFPVFNRKKNDRFNNARDIIEELFRLSQCSLNIHGHIHSRTTDNKFCINVSVEKTSFKPIKISDILHLYKDK